MYIALDPYPNPTNEYINLIAGAIALKEENIIFSWHSVFKSWKNFKKTNIVYLNWYESLLAHTTIYQFYRDLVIRICKLLIIKGFNKKVIWTFHNKQPHNEEHLYWKKWMMRFLSKKADAIIILSKVSKDILKEQYNVEKKKIFYCPHPNYVGIYGKITTDNIKRKENKLQLLFLGAIKPYKNIELLIDVVKKIENVELLIAGLPESKAYKKKIMSYSEKCANIFFNFEFIENEKIPKLIGNTDILVLPYDLQSSLNSGTIILAFSYGKSVIAPLIGTMSDIPPDYKKCVFSYTYITEEEHRRELTQQIQTAYDRRSELETFGKRMFHYIEENNSLNMISDILESINRTIFISNYKND